MSQDNVQAAPNFKTCRFTNAVQAVDYIQEIYQANIDYIQQSFARYVDGAISVEERFSGFYPFLRVQLDYRKPVQSHRSYGYITMPGMYEAVLTRPDIFRDYYIEQCQSLLDNHGIILEVGQSASNIPIHFALNGIHVEANIDQDKVVDLANHFDLPNLSEMNEAVANGTQVYQSDEVRPLSLFKPQRVDISLQRLMHYTGTSAEHFQNFVIFTNYQFYVDQFIEIANELMADEKSEYSSFVEVGDYEVFHKKSDEYKAKGNGKRPELSRMPQMPAYHLKRKDMMGITLINIGVGPSNAKTITDHVAVLRPHAWVMLGHCAGLRNSQSMGDYVLAHAYLREDNVLDKDVHISIPIPPLAEIQLALQESVKKISGLSDDEVKRIMRTGTVATVDDRNWEFKEQKDTIRHLSQSRAVALDMESATIATNGFRFRVPYGTLLCVSDKPLHGQLKLPGMADAFYRNRVNQHLKIGIQAMEELRKNGTSSLHSRKLRSFNEVAFQ